jgi:hypothetical protein
VAGSVNEPYVRIARRDDEIAERVDRDTIAREPLCEGRVGDRIERNDNAGYGRDQRERAAIRSQRTGAGDVNEVGMRGTCSVEILSARSTWGTHVSPDAGWTVNNPIRCLAGRV